MMKYFPNCMIIGIITEIFPLVNWYRENISEIVAKIEKFQKILFARNEKEKTHTFVCVFGDPYGNRTHVFAVRGRCLSRLTNGPGSGSRI